MVRVRRPNYPFNCYTLDLSEHEDIKNVWVKQLYITFKVKKNYSMELLLEDKALACNREIKYHKFYFSGSSLELKDLGDVPKTSWDVCVHVCGREGFPLWLEFGECNTFEKIMITLFAYLMFYNLFCIWFLFFWLVLPFTTLSKFISKILNGHLSVHTGMPNMRFYFF